VTHAACSCLRHQLHGADRKPCSEPSPADIAEAAAEAAEIAAAPLLGLADMRAAGDVLRAQARQIGALCEMVGRLRAHVARLEAAREDDAKVTLCHCGAPGIVRGLVRATVEGREVLRYGWRCVGHRGEVV
jgi:hypothetical protein